MSKAKKNVKETCDINVVKGGTSDLCRQEKQNFEKNNLGWGRAGIVIRDQDDHSKHWEGGPPGSKPPKKKREKKEEKKKSQRPVRRSWPRKTIQKSWSEERVQNRERPKIKKKSSKEGRPSVVLCCGAKNLSNSGPKEKPKEAPGEKKEPWGQWKPKKAAGMATKRRGEKRKMPGGGYRV